MISRRRAAPLLLAATLAACSAGPADRARPDQPAAGTSTSHTATPAPSSSSSASARPAPTATPAATPARAATTATVPPLSARARAAGLVDVRTVVPDAVIDLRYATKDNFTHVRLYPRRARCLVHRSMAHGLKTAATWLRRHHLVLVFWDCYRPHYVQVAMFRIVPDPAWVARPGPYATSHEAGRSVDVTLARAATGGTCRAGVQRHCLLAMGTGFDDFTPRAHAYATQGVSARAQANRATLRRAMKRGGITVYVGEWWHFDGPGSGVSRPLLHAPLS